jgi:hypothetical protein
MEMMSDFDLAKRLFPRPADVVREATAGIPSTSQVRGYATGDSADGTVTVVLDAAAGGEDAEMEVPTMGGISEGSEVLVTLLDGTPVDCSQVGSIDAATATAIDAKSVAEAVGQHVWTDTNGLHVTEVTQDEWEDSGGAEYHSGMNVLINSLGQLFRAGLTNLLAIVSGSTPSVAIYDGQGNADGNIVAKFASDLIELGGNSASSEIKLCGGAGKITAGSGGGLTIRGEQVSLVSQEESSGGNSSSTYIGSGITNSMWYIDLTAESVETGGYVSIDILPCDEYGHGSTPNVKFDSNELSGSVIFPLSSIIDAIPVTLYDNASASASASATLSETAANFKRLTIFFKDSDNNYSSVDVWSPNGKRVALSLTWINGASTQLMYQRVRWVSINGTSISTYRASTSERYRTGQAQIGGTGGVTNSDYISIVHVIGYR